MSTLRFRPMLVFLVLSLLMLQPSLISAAAETVTYTDNIQIDTSVGACNGEEVRLAGTLNIVSHVTTNAEGSIQLASTFNYAGVSGVGLTTGLEYQLVGVKRGTVTTTGALQSSQLQTTRMIGLGSTEDYVLRIQSHVTYNANYELTASSSTFIIDCP